VSSEDHEELSPLHRLRKRIQARLDTNLKHADSHRDPNVRSSAAIRVQCYRLVMSELSDTLTEVAKDNVDRILAARRASEESNNQPKKENGT